MYAHHTLSKCFSSDCMDLPEKGGKAFHLKRAFVKAQHMVWSGTLKTSIGLELERLMGEETGEFDWSWSLKDLLCQVLIAL